MGCSGQGQAKGNVKWWPLSTYNKISVTSFFDVEQFPPKSKCLTHAHFAHGKHGVCFAIGKKLA